MKIHPVISVVHLEQCFDDPFRRQIPDPEPIVIDGKEHHVIDKILRKEKRNKQLWYKVRWRDQDRTETWEPGERLQQDVPEMLERFNRSRMA